MTDANPDNMDRFNTNDLGVNNSAMVEEGKFLESKTSERIETLKEDEDFFIFFPDFYEVDLM